jgi:Leucine-rich repeat (LRR) protein
MSEFELHKASLIRLIETWSEENLELAVQIASGDSELKVAILERYGNLLSFFCKNEDICEIVNIADRFKLALSAKTTLPYSKTLEEILPTFPVTEIIYIFAKMTEFPWWVCKMPQLKSIDFSHNEIENIPVDILRLENLENLTLKKNRINTLPDFICDVKKLEILQLDFNEIEVLPDNIGKLSNLRWLCLENNKIKKLPKSAANLKNLTWLSIEGTPLGKENKVSYGTFTNVETAFFKKLLDN